jgi:hypothetical protein
MLADTNYTGDKQPLRLRSLLGAKTEAQAAA